MRWRWSYQAVEDRLPDGSQGRLRGRPIGSFFPSRGLEVAELQEGVAMVAADLVRHFEDRFAALILLRHKWLIDPGAARTSGKAPRHCRSEHSTQRRDGVRGMALRPYGYVQGVWNRGEAEVFRGSW